MEKIDRTLKALNAIIASKAPVADDKKIARHYERIDDARRYREELEDIAKLYQGEPRLSIVAKNTFERIIANSDFVEITEMQFIRVASVVNFPSNKNHIYLWLTPVTEL